MKVSEQLNALLAEPGSGATIRAPEEGLSGRSLEQEAGSGGDALPYYFKYYELGPVIGTRTWGGLVGISRGIPLLDGGSVTFPEFGLFNVNGDWDVENYGVEPTIEIDNLRVVADPAPAD